MLQTASGSASASESERGNEVYTSREIATRSRRSKPQYSIHWQSQECLCAQGATFGKPSKQSNCTCRPNGIDTDDFEPIAVNYFQHDRGDTTRLDEYDSNTLGRFNDSQPIIDNCCEANYESARSTNSESAVAAQRVSTAEYAIGQWH
jgi:hypothetical protein